MAQDDEATTVEMQHFENVEVLPKNGAKKKCLKAVEIDVTLHSEFHFKHFCQNSLP